MNKLTKKIFLTSLLVLTGFNTHALTIHNDNSQRIDIEIMDISGSMRYGYPSSWETCKTSWLIDPGSGRLAPVANCYKDFDKYRHDVDFVLTRRNFNYGDSLIVEQSKYPALTENVNIKLTGYTGSVKLTNIKSTCEITVKDNGFLRGIKAQIANCN